MGLNLLSITVRVATVNLGKFNVFETLWRHNVLFILQSGIAMAQFANQAMAQPEKD